MSQIICNECGGFLILSKSGEYVCEKCGLVYEGAKIDALIKREYEERNNTSYQYVEVLNKSPFKTSISWYKFNGKSREKTSAKTLMRYYNKLDFVQRYYIDGLPIKSIRRAYAVLLSLCSLIPMQMTSSVKRRALEMYYTTVIKNKHVKKNHVALMTASFYIALRERNKGTDLTLKKLIMHVRKLGFNVTLSDVFKALFTLRKTIGVLLKPRKSDDLLPIAVNKIISDNNIRSKLAKNNIDLLLYSRRLYEEARSLLQKSGLQKNPLSLIAAALYTADKILASKYQWKEVLTQKTLSSILDVSPFTIRELYYKAFRKYIFGDDVEK
ncbi:MAG: transcription initiation factor IIB family protein [Candidatus Nezhaarchaeales archaeon]